MIQKLNNKKTPQKHFKTAEPDLPSNEFRARLIDSTQELEAIVQGWNRLAEMAVRPNPFFEPGFLIPAFEHLNDVGAQVLVVEAPPRAWPDGSPVLCALFPITKRRFYKLPLSCFEVWKHAHCFDCTPLIRSDCAADVLGFVFEFLATKASLLSFDTIAGQGEFQRLLTDVLYDSGRSVFHRDAFNRACFYPASDAETYLQAHVSKGTRKGTRRLRRKLETIGELRVSNYSQDDDLQSWIDDFLMLESSGWKGNDQTSLQSNPSQTKFFCDIARRSVTAGKMTFLKVELDDRPIAMICDLQSGNYGSAYKIAFDEAYSEYSPGVIAELENIDRLHDSNLASMDSCAAPNHSMINRIWSGRTRYQSLVVALGGKASQFATATMPLIQQVKNLFKRKASH